MPYEPAQNKPKACDACRARKLKCSNRDVTNRTLATCDHCARSGLSCASSQQPRKRRPRPGKYVFESTKLGEGWTEKIRHRIVDALRSGSVAGNSADDPQTGTEVPVSTSPSSTPSPDYMSSYEAKYMTSERTTEVFSFFMHNIYAILPVINFDSFTNHLNQDQHNWDVEFSVLAFALEMLYESYMRKLTPTGGTRNILSCISTIEQLRCRYDYAEDPTADTVIVSFALFVAYNVVGKHQRALLYLLEASKLVNFTRTDSLVEAMRIQRLKALLFITTSAATLLSKNSAWAVDMALPLDVEDLISWYSVAGASAGDMASEDIRDLDQFAIRHLRLMTQIYRTARGGASWEYPGEDNVASCLSGAMLPATRMVRTVIADLSITQLWFSSDRRRLHNSGNYYDISKQCQNASLAETTGRKALAWARSLSQSELRIVGLGKMVDILENMVHLCSLDPNSTAEVEILARDLMTAISTADYESMYATTLTRSAELLRHMASIYGGSSCGPVISEVTKHSDA